jgi:hypothetical protein
MSPPFWNRPMAAMEIYDLRLLIDDFSIVMPTPKS